MDIWPPFSLFLNLLDFSI
jgi:hypothetical protein